MHIRNIIKTMAFICILTILFQYVQKVMIFKTLNYWADIATVQDLYKLEKNSIDVVNIGGSNALTSFAPMELYENYGISAYNLGTTYQPVFISYYLLEELLKYQSPKVLFFDITNSYYINTPEFSYRQTIDNMRWSSTKISAITEHVKHPEAASLVSYFFPIAQYHSNWKTFSQKDFLLYNEDVDDLYSMGYYMWPGMGDIEYSGTIRDESQYHDFDNDGVPYFSMILELCENNDIDVILYNTPRDWWDQSQSNFFIKKAEQIGIPYFDFNYQNILQEIDYQFPLDHADRAHPNVRGAVKITGYFGRYLNENYVLPDHRGDINYSFLEEELQDYNCKKENQLLLLQTDLSSYLDFVKNSHYTVFISVKDEASSGLNEELMNKLFNLGIQSDLRDKYQYSFIAVCENGVALHEEISKEKIEFAGVFSDETPIYMMSAGYVAGDDCSIKIANQECAKNMRGLNIVVYDNVTNKIVDKVNFDTYEENSVAVR